jgi:iron-sulfur cluster repair protein YtfE (RIC family)
MPDILQFDPNLTVKEIAATHPQTVAVFRRFGFDTCCGGGVRVDEAARRDGVDVNDVYAALNAALAPR